MICLPVPQPNAAKGKKKKENKGKKREKGKEKGEEATTNTMVRRGREGLKEAAREQRRLGVTGQHEERPLNQR
jgi:hypothetical protein